LRTALTLDVIAVVIRRHSRASADGSIVRVLTATIHHILKARSRAFIAQRRSFDARLATHRSRGRLLGDQSTPTILG
jgi:hypothetical protein